MPRISIVTPSYQQGRFLQQTIESVLSQDVAGLEYYVADGGSTDESVDILRKYGGQIRWVSENDRGQAHAVNKGIAATSAPIIGWINSDDVYYPGVLRAVMEHFDSHPDTDVLYGGADHIGEDGAILEAYPTEPWNPRRLIETCFLCQPAVFFRRSVVAQSGLLDERLHYCMDYEYWLRLALESAQFAHIGRKLAGSRMYASNKTLGASVQAHAEINDMMKRVFGAAPPRWIWNYAHVVVRERGALRESDFRYALAVSRESCKASLRWNHNVSARVLAMASTVLAARVLAKLRSRESL